MESIRTYRSNPYLVISTYHIPTWTTPLLLILGVAALVPGTSLLGHLCGVAVGYVCESPSLPALCVGLFTDECTNRWPGLPEVPCTPRLGAPLDRVQAQPSRHPAALRQRRPKDIRPLRRAPQQQQKGRQRSLGARRQQPAPRSVNALRQPSPKICIITAILCYIRGLPLNVRSQDYEHGRCLRRLVWFFCLFG